MCVCVCVCNRAIVWVCMRTLTIIVQINAYLVHSALL